MGLMVEETRDDGVADDGSDGAVAFVDEMPAEAEPEGEVADAAAEDSGVGFVDEVPAETEDAETGDAEGEDAEAEDSEAGDDVAFSESREADSDGEEPDWGPKAEESRLSAQERAQILATRPTVKPPEWVPIPTEHFAYCPACDAKNHLEAALCGRCGTEIPSAVPQEGVRNSKRGQNVARKGHEGPVYVPDEVQARLDVKAVEQAERINQRKVRYRWRRWSTTLGSGSFFLVFQGVVNAAFYYLLVDESLAVPFLIATAIGAGAGALAGRNLFQRGGGRFEGTLLYGGAAVLGNAAMLIAGGYRMLGGHDTHLTGTLAGIIFLWPICFLLFSMCLGSMLGMSLELQQSDD